MPLPTAWHPMPHVGAAEIKDPILRHAPTRKSVACFGAVSLRTGTFVRSLCATFNAVTFEPF